MFLAITLLLLLFAATLLLTTLRPRRAIPISVNYHFTRKCNYSCGFCFHTAKTSYILPLPDAERGLRLLKASGMRKINFAGGEPFLYPKHLAHMLSFCKSELHLESVSIVTNGSLITERFLEENAKYIDILAVSCDSFNEDTNIRIGRGKGGHVAKLRSLSRLCRKYNIKFKINTVINRFNFEEDMNAEIQEIAPFRWKCFQVLVVQGENSSAATLRDATEFAITDAEFEYFCGRHAGNACFVPESNRVMMSSYLILDEYMRFLDKSAEMASESILEVGVAAALEKARWDEDSFKERGGVYEWTKGSEGCGSSDPKLEW